MRRSVKERKKKESDIDIKKRRKGKRIFQSRFSREPEGSLPSSGVYHHLCHLCHLALPPMPSTQSTLAARPYPFACQVVSQTATCFCVLSSQWVWCVIAMLHLSSSFFHLLSFSFSFFFPFFVSSFRALSSFVFHIFFSVFLRCFIFSSFHFLPFLLLRCFVPFFSFFFHFPSPSSLLHFDIYASHYSLISSPPSFSSFPYFFSSFSVASSRHSLISSLPSSLYHRSFLILSLFDLFLSSFSYYLLALTFDLVYVILPHLSATQLVNKHVINMRIWQRRYCGTWAILVPIWTRLRLFLSLFVFVSLSLHLVISG